jgi:ferrous iron transport protein B
VLVFVPVLFSLYFAIAILEDSGYMARAAFVMDRLMHLLGMHGKSFLPLMVGFGCNVPAIYATRTLENELDRKITGFLTTFMSCGARLPVYVVFGAAFFGTSSGSFVFSMYLVGIGVAIFTSLILNKIVFRGKPTPPFVMELPPYRMPNMRTVWILMWGRTADFLKNAATIILAASLLIWLLMAISTTGERFGEATPEDSLLGKTSGAFTPIFAPAGFGDWQAVSALVTGLAAKEVVVSTMNQIYTRETEEETEATPSVGDDLKDTGKGFIEAGVLTVQEIVNIIPRTVNLLPAVNVPEADFLNQAEEEEDNSALESALQERYSVPAAVAFNVFILLYVPCMTAVAAMRHEFGLRWTLIQVFYTLAVAWVMAVIVYQLGNLV